MTPRASQKESSDYKNLGTKPRNRDDHANTDYDSHQLPNDIPNNSKTPNAQDECGICSTRMYSLRPRRLHKNCCKADIAS